MNISHQGMTEDTTKPFRHAVRAIILDRQENVLLCQFRPPHPAVPRGITGVWAAPGGGVESGEFPLEALRRELLEETGLTVNTDPPYVWRQEVVAAEHRDGEIGILNDYFLVRTAHFDPRGILSDDDIAAEGIDVMRGWALSDIAAYSGPDLSSPRDLSSLLSDLIAGGVPRTPVPLGEPIPRAPGATLVAWPFTSPETPPPTPCSPTTRSRFWSGCSSTSRFDNHVQAQASPIET